METNVSTTFERIGLRAEKAIATHILLENTYNSNLVPDISKVDYLANNNGRTHIQTLEGLPTFVDDLYVFGYLQQKDCVVSKGKVLCTTGATSSAKNIVSRIYSNLSDLVEYKHVHIAIVHTLSISAKNSTISSTIDRIERETNSKAKENWKQQHPNTPIYALFVAKLDVSELSIEHLHKILPTFEERLVANGYGIYSIDYTRDFSGTLDRQALVEYLAEEHNFREQGTFVEAIQDSQPTILDNTHSVGNHVCTWISEHSGYTTRTKLYNKIVSNFEAGEIREQFGGHLADYVDCPNEHLRKTFHHPDVQSRGCTRIEVSLYACRDRTPETANELVDDVLEFVSPANNPLFVVQPAKQQWNNLAKELDRCFVLADRPQSAIYVCWYAHTRTKRMAGVRIRPTQNTVDDDKLWNTAILWAMGDFGFRNCPIFQTEILCADKYSGIHLSKLQCYTKDKNSKTILVACNRPCQLHPDVEPPTMLLPPTNTIEWEWRPKKTHTIGVEQPIYKLHKIEKIAEQKQISLLSSTDREKKLAQIGEEQCAEEWRQSVIDKLENYHKEHTNTIEQREREIEQIYEEMERNERDQYNSLQIEKLVERTFLGKIEHISKISNKGIWSVLGYRQQDGKDHCRVVVAKDDGEPISIWANTGLRKILHATKKFVECKKDRYNRELCWFPKERIFEEDDLYKQKRIQLLFRVLPPKKFVPNGSDKEIEWFPVEPTSVPDGIELPSLVEIALEKELEKKEIETKSTLGSTSLPLCTEWKKILEIEPGQYICRKYAVGEYRKKEKYILYIVPTDNNGIPSTDIEMPVHGYFLEKEIERYGGREMLEKTKQPMLCRVGGEKTNPQKKKDRLFYIVASIEEN